MRILELNAIRKDWRNKIKFALCIPSIYRVGMSSLAMHTIYDILNSFEDVCCERVFLSHDSLPPLSVESNQPLHKFDFVGFSLHYEINYTNVIDMLVKSNIPIASKDRDSSYPIILAGGPVCVNPLPLSPFIDLFVIGDFEPISQKLMNFFKETREKEAFLEQVKDIQGVYVPKYTQGVVKKVYEKNLDNCPPSIYQIIPQLKKDTSFSPSFGKSFLLEISRGCSRRCRFCLEGHQGLPFRVRSLETIQNIISQGIKETNVNKISLIGSGLSDHPKLEDIVWDIVNRGLELSLSSLRVDCISEDLLRAILKGNQKTLTLAPEAGSDRLLDIIHKGFSVEDALSTIKLIRGFGFKNLKLYFMYNLPTETSDDIKAIADLVQKVNQIGFKGSNLKLSINNFIPKAHTPFQWEPLTDLKVLREKMKELRKFIKMPIDFLDIRWARIQTYLSLGGADLGKAVNLAAKFGAGLGAWTRALKDTDYNFKKYNLDSNLPWDFIRFESKKEILIEEYKKVMG